MKLRYAKRIDFTGTLRDFSNFDKFDDGVIALLRDKASDKGRAEVAIIVDRAVGYRGKSEALLVSDHINLAGTNPLVGPNDPVGERFPVVNNIYLTADDTMDQEETWSMGNPLGKMRSIVIAGVRHGIQPTAAEDDFMRSLDASACTYNLVPSMIVAAHAGLKVLGIVLPEGASLSPEVMAGLLR